MSLLARLQGVAQRPLARFGLALLLIGLPFLLANAVTRLLLTDTDLHLLRNPFKTAVLLAAYALFVRWVELRPVTEWSRPGAVREMAQGFGAATGLITLVVLVLAMAGWLHVERIGSVTGMAHMLGLHLFVALLEELLFRGVVFRLLEAAMGSTGALLVSTLLFGLAHGANPGANALTLGALGLLSVALTLAFMATRRLWLCVGLHWGWNFAQGGLFGLPVSGTQVGPGLWVPRVQGPEWASGGAFGLEASVLTLLLLTALCAHLARLARRRGHWRARTGPANR